METFFFSVSSKKRSSLEKLYFVILHEGHALSCRICCFTKQKKTFSLREKVPFRADEGLRTTLMSGPHPPSARVPPLPKGEGHFPQYRFSTPLTASHRMTGIMLLKKVGFTLFFTSIKHAVEPSHQGKKGKLILSFQCFFHLLKHRMIHRHSASIKHRTL